MRQAYAVIGANFGDEGKGLVTDALCRRIIDGGGVPVVIRHNGTAQATHTVVSQPKDAPNGTFISKHRFSHIGSGTFAGAPTFLAKSFYNHPAAYYDEWRELVKNNHQTPNITIDPDSAVVLPTDVAINRILEKMRGNDKHGSCGMGFFEAVKRHNSGGRLTFGSLADGADQVGIDWMLRSMNSYYDKRIAELGISKEALKSMMEILGIDERFKVGFQLLAVMPRARWKDYEGRNLDLVFEGAQGLGLDQNYGVMPYCTPSDCGLANPFMMCKEIRRDRLDPIYVTRCYVTRHGAGPLLRVPQDIVWDGFTASPDDMKKHDTNSENPWQDGIRYAPIQVDTFNRIAGDMARFGYSDQVKCSPSLAYTWRDYYLGELHEEEHLPIHLIASGPTARDVVFAADIPKEKAGEISGSVPVSGPDVFVPSDCGEGATTG